MPGLAQTPSPPPEPPAPEAHRSLIRWGPAPHEAPPPLRLTPFTAAPRSGLRAAVLARFADALPENQLARFITMNVLGEGGVLLVGFVASIVLARLLGPGGRGLLGLMLSANVLAMFVFSIGLPTAVTYFASRDDADPAAILGNCLLHASVLAVVLIPATWLLHDQIARALGDGGGGETWVLVAVLLAVMLLDWTTQSQLQGSLRFARANVVAVLGRTTYAFAVIVLVGFASLGVTGAVIATLIGSVVLFTGSLSPILAYGRPRLDRGLMKRMYGYGARAEVGSILQFANGRLDVLILQIYRPLSQVGYYVVAQTVAELVALLAQQFRWTGMVLVTKAQGEERQASMTADAVRHYAIISVIAALANVVFGSAVILFAYGSRFHPALVPMLILLPGVCMLGLGIVIQGDLSGRGRPGLASSLSGVSAAVTTSLDFLLIPRMGAVGAALASVVGYSALGMASLVALHRVSGIPLRTLVVPTRADLKMYWGFVATRVRGRSGRQT